MLKSKYQTITQFIFSPFNDSKSSIEKDTKYSTMYLKYRRTNKIRLAAVTEIEGSWYFHIKVPSESQNKVEYDVVIRFFTNSDTYKKETHLRNYYIQFFSNSPSFIYQYAYVYKQKGYLIEKLYNKMDSEFLDTPPTKTNKDENLSYDKSIYFAVRFLASERFKYLGKLSSVFFKRSPEKFFRGISDINTKRVEQEITKEEKKLQNEHSLANRSEIRKNINKIKNDKQVPVKHTKGFTKVKSVTKIKGTKKITGKKQTSGISRMKSSFFS